MAPVICWFRRDLRQLDHPALAEAARVAGPDGVIALFVIDDELLAPCGPARAHQLAASLGALEASGVPLTVRAGQPAQVISALCEETGAHSVFATADHAPYGAARDLAVEAALEAAGRRLERRSSNYVVAPGTVRSAEGAPLKVFSAFRRRWEAVGPVPVIAQSTPRWVSAPSTAAISEIPSRAGRRRPALFGDLPDGPPHSPPPAGELAALERLGAFAARAPRYKDERNLPAEEGTSKLSAALRFGELHPRTVLAAVAGPDEGSATFRSEICWREFYADVLFHWPRSVRASLQPAMAGLRVDTGPAAEERFRTWARGETGVPLVDAGMRQLLECGWMHNRARMVTASFLVKHLHLDWRWGARWFMWRLADGDLASNTHGWQWTAGTGTDAAPFHRIFSPVAQAERFDAEARYIHRFVPELAGIDAPQVLAPGGGVDLLHPAEYPAPMVDLKLERTEALERAAAARASYRERS